MPLSSTEVTANWLEAMVRPGATPTFSVQIDTDASTSFKFISSNDTALGTDWLPHVVRVAPLSAKIDPITRDFDAGALNVVLLDQGTGTAGIRDAIKNNYFKGKRIIVKIGEESLAEADYAPYFRGVIHDFVPREGEVVIVTKDAFQILEDITLPLSVDEQNNLEFNNEHPLEYIETILSDANFATDLYDSTSLDPSQYTSSISHWSCVLAKHEDTDASAQGEVSALDYVRGLCRLMHGGFIPHEDGKLTFARFDASAAADDDWTTDDILSFEQLSTTEHQINRAIVKFMVEKVGDELTTTRKMMHGNTDAQGNDAYPGQSEKMFTRVFETLWNNAKCELHTTLNTTDTTVVLHSGHLDSFSGCTNDGANFEPSATRLVYLMLVHEFGLEAYNRVEVIECDAVTLDSGVWSTDGSVKFTTKATFDITTNGRIYTEGGSGTGRKFNPGASVYDVTILVDWLKSEIERRSGGGMPIVKVKTSLSKYATQVTDLVTLDLSGLDDQNLFLMYNKDGVTGTDKWEVVEKFVNDDALEISWVLAKATSTTGYTEEWEPGSAEGSGIKPDIVVAHDNWGGISIPGSVSDVFTSDGNSFAVDSGLNMNFTGGANVGPTAAKPTADFSTFAVTASKDTFMRFDAISGRVMGYEVTTGSAAPALGKFQAPLAQIVAGASAISSITDMRKMDRILADPGVLGSSANGVMNSDFEHATMPALKPPTGWYLDNKGGTTAPGVWVTDADVETTVVLEGTRSLVYKTQTGKLRSAMIPIREGEWYEATIWVRADSVAAGREVDIDLEQYKVDKITFVDSNSAHSAVLNTVNTWEIKTVVFQGGTDARFAQFVIYESGGTAFNMYIDRVTLRPHNGYVKLELSANDTGNSKTTKIALNTATHDTTGGFQSGTNDWDVPTGQAGKYILTGSIQFANIGSGLAWAVIQVNGSTVTRGPDSGTTGGIGSPTGTVIEDLAEGDTVSLVAGVTVDVSWDAVAGAGTYLCIYRLSEAE